MHIEILIEDSSGKKLLEHLLPRIWSEQCKVLTWRVHEYKGVGKIPKNLQSKADPKNRILLDNLARVLKGYARTPGIDAVVVILDTDKRNCVEVLSELKTLVQQWCPALNVMFRLAVEEMEAWYLGDEPALLAAYPRVRKDVLKRYVQDSICNTWELLAEAIEPKLSGPGTRIDWVTAGTMKHEWAREIGSRMDVEKNTSISFCKLRDGLRKLCSQ